MSDRLNVRFEGIAELRQLLSAAGPAALEIARQTIDDVNLETESQAKQLVPVASGNLQRNIKAAPAEVEAQTARGIVAASTPYAAAVHENLRANHKQGQAKYLEIPFRRNGSQFPARLKQALKKAGLA